MRWKNPSAGAAGRVAKAQRRPQHGGVRRLLRPVSLWPRLCAQPVAAVAVSVYHMHSEQLPVIRSGDTWLNRSDEELRRSTGMVSHQACMAAQAQQDGLE